jgi:hypothetical protein
MHLIYKTLSILTLLALPFLGWSQAIPVTVEKINGKYTLVRGGKPYYIKGAGGKTQIEELVRLGGNSIRTWGVDEADEAFALAEKYNLTVMMGLWVQHERHGFDYNNEAAVKKQLEDFKKVILKYKDHPNLLLWGIGNEVDLFYSNPKVWDAIQDICKFIHEVDPNHPTSTVTAGLEAEEVVHINNRVPDLDIYGINTYGDIAKISENLYDFGWHGPYIVSEWGPNGHWEVDKTTWGAPIEQTSTEKAASYAMRYKKYVEEQREYCVGSYVFLWGQKQETTSTWYGLFTDKGHPTEPLDELYKAWQGSTPKNSSPTIDSLVIEGEKDPLNIRLTAGDKYKANLFASDPDNDNIKVKWLIYPESMNTKAGGDFESSLQPELGLFISRADEKASFRAPDEEGPYRLFVFVQDGDRRTAYANIPFYSEPRTEADGALKPVRFKPRKLEVQR